VQKRMLCGNGVHDIFGLATAIVRKQREKENCAHEATGRLVFQKTWRTPLCPISTISVHGKFAPELQSMYVLAGSTKALFAEKLQMGATCYVPHWQFNIPGWSSNGNLEKLKLQILPFFLKVLQFFSLLKLEV